MARMTEQEVYFGTSPVYKTGEDIDGFIQRAVYHYKNTASKKHLHGWLEDYAKSQGYESVGDTLECFCVYAKLLLDKVPVTQDYITELHQEIAKRAIKEEPKQDKPKAEHTPKRKVLDRTWITPFDNLIDDAFATGAGTKDFKVFDYCLSNNLTKGQTKEAKASLEAILNEISDYKNDPDLTQAYGIYSDKRIKQVTNVLSEAVSDLSRYAARLDASAEAGKIRNGKNSTLSDVVSGIKCMPFFDELKISSIKPDKIVGASELYVYDTEHRLLRYYKALSADGLGVKSAKVIGWDEKLSFVRTIRKPDEVLPLIINGTPAKTLKQIKDLKVVEKPMKTGMMSGTLILLRAN